MKTPYIILGALIIIIVGVGLFSVYPKPYKAQKPLEKFACTMEAKICPDGSTVGRTGPNCEFADCPSIPTVPEGGIINNTVNGVIGTAMMGPICPVQQNPPDPKCADRPYQGKLVLVTPDGSDALGGSKSANGPKVVKEFSSDASGKFKIEVVSGQYVIQSSMNVFPRCSSNAFFVTSDSFTNVSVTCDTGIR